MEPFLNNRNKTFDKSKELSTGIFLENYRTKSGSLLTKVRAHYSLKDVVYSRSWSVTKYGYDEAVELASCWRKEQIRLLNEQGAGYTERHGT